MIVTTGMYVEVRWVCLHVKVCADSWSLIKSPPITANKDTLVLSMWLAVKMEFNINHKNIVRPNLFTGWIKVLLSFLQIGLIQKKILISNFQIIFPLQKFPPPPFLI